MRVWSLILVCGRAITCQGREVVMCHKLVNVLQLLQDISSNLQQHDADDLEVYMRSICSLNVPGFFIAFDMPDWFSIIVFGTSIHKSNVLPPSKSLETCAVRRQRLELSAKLRADEQSMISHVMTVLNSEVARKAFQGVKVTTSVLTGPTFLSIEQRGPCVPIRVAALRRLQRGARAHKCTIMEQMASMLEIGHVFPEIINMIEDETEMMLRKQMVDSERQFICESMHPRTPIFEIAPFSSLEAKSFVDTEFVGKFHHLKNLHNDVTLQIRKTKHDYFMNGDAQDNEMGVRADEVKSRQRSFADVGAVERILQNTVDNLKTYYGNHSFKGSGTDDHEEHLEADLPPRSGQEKEGKGEEVLSMVMSLMEEVASEHALLDEDEEDATWGHWRLMNTLELESTSLREKLARLSGITASLEIGGSLGDQELSSIDLFMKTIKTGCDYDAQSYASQADGRAQKLALLEEVEALLRLQVEKIVLWQ